MPFLFTRYYVLCRVGNFQRFRIFLLCLSEAISMLTSPIKRPNSFLNFFHKHLSHDKEKSKRGFEHEKRGTVA